MILREDAELPKSLFWNFLFYLSTVIPLGSVDLTSLTLSFQDAAGLHIVIL